MHHRFCLSLAKRTLQERAIDQVAFDQTARRHRLAMAGAEVVVYTNLVTFPLQSRDGVTADVTSSTGDKDSHRPYWRSGARFAVAHSMNTVLHTSPDCTFLKLRAYEETITRP